MEVLKICEVWTTIELLDVVTDYHQLAGNNNTEEGNYIHKNNKTYKEELHWLDEWMTPKNNGVGAF
jgi:hypothetical protein